MPKTIVARFTISLLFILAVIACSIYGVMILRGEPKLVSAQVQAAEQSSLAIARQLSIKLSEIEGKAASMAALGQSLPTDADLVKPALEAIIDGEGDRSIAGGGLWPEPNSFTQGVDLDSLYWARSSEGRLQFSTENNSPGMEPYQAASWYQQGKKAAVGKCGWSDAYVDPVSKVLMTTCSVGYSRDGKFSGVATIDLTLNGLADFLSSSGGVTGGYAFAIDRSGNVLFLPGIEPGTQIASAKDMIESYPWFSSVLEKGRNSTGTTTVFVEHEKSFGSSAYVSLVNVSASGWVIGLVTLNRPGFSRHSPGSGNSAFQTLPVTAGC